MNATDPTGEIGIFGFIAGAVVDVVMQTVVEGKSIGEIDVGSVLVSGVAGATGLGALKQGLNVLKAVKKVKNAKKAVQKAKKFTNNKNKQASKRKIKNAQFREGKAREKLSSATKDAVKTTSKAVGAVAGTAAAKKASPEVTVKDVVDGAKETAQKVKDEVNR